MPRCLNGAAPQYLSELIQRLSNVDSRHRLRSASTAEVLVPATRRSTIGDRALYVVGPRAWDNLSVHCRSAPVLDIFYFQNTPEVTSVQHILPFSLTVSLTIFVQSPWSRLCCLCLSKCVIITLHYITSHAALIQQQKIITSTKYKYFSEVQSRRDLESRLGVTQGHWKWHHSIDRIRVFISIPL